jgi:hypothetical protein
VQGWAKAAGVRAALGLAELQACRCQSLCNVPALDAFFPGTPHLCCDHITSHPGPRTLTFLRSPYCTVLHCTAPPRTAGYEACVPRIVRVLERCKQRDVSQDYTYYGLASPWLQVKCLRVLQYFPPPEEPSVRRMLAEIVKRILGGEAYWGGSGGERSAVGWAGEVCVVVGVGWHRMKRNTAGLGLGGEECCRVGLVRWWLAWAGMGWDAMG